MMVIRALDLPFLAIFKEYFGFKSIKNYQLDLSILGSNFIKVFQKIVNCWEIFDVLSKFWIKIISMEHFSNLS